MTVNIYDTHRPGSSAEIPLCNRLPIQCLMEFVCSSSVDSLYFRILPRPIFALWFLNSVPLYNQVTP